MRLFAPDCSEIVSTRAPARPFSANSSFAASRMACLVRSASRSGSAAVLGLDTGGVFRCLVATAFFTNNLLLKTAPHAPNARAAGYLQLYLQFPSAAAGKSAYPSALDPERCRAENPFEPICHDRDRPPARFRSIRDGPARFAGKRLAPLHKTHAGRSRWQANPNKSPAGPGGRTSFRAPRV